MAIEALTISSAGGLELGNGEVTHFSESSALEPNAISAPTRQLAFRDNLIADKVNEIVNQVNNQEQYVNLPTIRTTLPPTTTEVTANFRIPVGYEARVLSATVASSPISQATLDVYWSDSFGNSTGSNVVSTASEYFGSNFFSQTGEFIVKIGNQGSVTADIVASVIVSMRPIGTAVTEAAVLGDLPRGPQGKKGDAGSPGMRGLMGPVGPDGAPGFNFQGAYSRANPYSKGDCVLWGGDGSYQQSMFYCSSPLGQSVTNPITPPYVFETSGTTIWYLENDLFQRTVTNNDFTVVKNDIWELLMRFGTIGQKGEKGDTGTTGATGIGSQGPVGPAGIQIAGSFTSGSFYGNSDVISYTDGANNRTFVNVGSGTHSYSNPLHSSDWLELFGPAAYVDAEFLSHQVTGTFHCGSPFTNGSTNGVGNNGNDTFFGVVADSAFTLTERNVQTRTGGIVSLKGQLNLNFDGSLTIDLPMVAGGAAYNWSGANVTATAIACSNTATVSPTRFATDSGLAFTVVGGPANVVIDINGLVLA